MLLADGGGGSYTSSLTPPKLTKHPHLPSGHISSSHSSSSTVRDRSRDTPPRLSSSQRADRTRTAGRRSAIAADRENRQSLSHHNSSRSRLAGTSKEGKSFWGGISRFGSQIVEGAVATGYEILSAARNNRPSFSHHNSSRSRLADTSKEGKSFWDRASHFGRQTTKRAIPVGHWSANTARHPHLPSGHISSSYSASLINDDWSPAEEQAARRNASFVYGNKKLIPSPKPVPVLGTAGDLTAARQVRKDASAALANFRNHSSLSNKGGIREEIERGLRQVLYIADKRYASAKAAKYAQDAPTAIPTRLNRGGIRQMLLDDAQQSASSARATYFHSRGLDNFGKPIVIPVNPPSPPAPSKPTEKHWWDRATGWSKGKVEDVGDKVISVAGRGSRLVVSRSSGAAEHLIQGGVFAVADLAKGGAKAAKEVFNGVSRAGVDVVKGNFRQAAVDLAKGGAKAAKEVFNGGSRAVVDLVTGNVRATKSLIKGDPSDRYGVSDMIIAGGENRFGLSDPTHDKRLKYKLAARGSSYLANYKDQWVRDNSKLINKYAAQNNLPPELVAAIAWEEAGGQPDVLDGTTYGLRERLPVLNQLDGGSLEGVPGLGRVLGSPEETSFGHVQMRVNVAAKLLGYENPDHLSHTQRKSVIAKLQEPETNISLVCRHLAELREKDFGNQTSPNMSDEELLVVASRYNLGPDTSLQSIKEKPPEYGTEVMALSTYTKSLVK
jgi:hypothetical protein